MFSLNPPAVTAETSFTTCVSKVKNAALKAKFDAAVDQIVEAADGYQNAALAGLLHTYPREAPFAGLTQNELDKVYTDRMAHPDAPGRDIYIKLRDSTPNSKCPLCAHRNVTTLDHHFPRTHYPALVVTPLNLIPSCFECNKAKLAGFPATAAEVALHPYFDAIDASVWLTSVVLETNPAVVDYGVDVVAGWDATLQARVELHFTRLGLGDLYATEAGDELSNIRHELAGLLDVGGEAAVQAQLADRAISCAQARRNGWRTGAYRAWAASPWFCAGGFLGKG